MLWRERSACSPNYYLFGDWLTRGLAQPDDWLNTRGLAHSGTGSLGDWLNPKGVPVPANDCKLPQRSEALTTMT